MVVLWGICGLMTWAQPQNYNALMEQAKGYFAQKDYAKSIECYELVIAELEGTEFESLVPSVRNSIAINNMYMGVAALKGKDYPTAKTHLENAIKDAKPDSKTYFMAHSWMGQWNSVQALNIRMNHGDLAQAVKLSLEAERYFDLANAPEKRLKEQLSRASVLQDLSRADEAEALLKQIMNECEGWTDRRVIMGKAAYGLGGLEMATERYQLAMKHLEQGYDLCLAGSTADVKAYAHLCATKLSQLFESGVPDADKAVLWKQRADETDPHIDK